MVEWYKLEEKERIKEYYSKYSIERFWKWWSDDTNSWMEIRTVNWKFAKEVGEKLGLPFSHTGVFVDNAERLKQVIAYCREKETIWFGVQPRKFGVSKWGAKCLSGGDNFVHSIKYVFIDIDRKIKNAPAQLEDLEQCNDVADEIIRTLESEDWNKSYCKICSGNGVQLLIKLDLPIEMPNVEYKPVKDSTGKNIYMYIPTKEFVKAKELIPKTLGDSLIKYIKKYCRTKKLDNVDIDKAGFRLAQVGALPVTKNYKFGGFTWRGIVELKDGENVGLCDYILDRGEGIKTAVNIFSISTASLNRKKRLKQGKLKENELVKFMLENNLPAGSRNNYLWFQLKCLLRDYKIPLHKKEFRELHNELQAKHGTLSLNLPDPKFKFNEDVINKWCINNNIKPVFKLWPKRNKFLDNWNELIWGNIDLVSGQIELDGSDEFEDMEEIKKKLVGGEHLSNKTIIYEFTKGMISKYGVERTKYLFDNVFERFFNYQ